MDNVAGLASGANFEGAIKIEEEKIRSHVDQVVRESRARRDDLAKKSRPSRPRKPTVSGSP
jgi:hypothetical protein